MVVIAGFLVFAALVVGVIAGCVGALLLTRKDRADKEAQNTRINVKWSKDIERLEAEIERKQQALDFERATTKALTEQLRKVSDQAKEAGLKVVATVTGPDSMNIAGSTFNAGGYRYDTNNS